MSPFSGRNESCDAFEEEPISKIVWKRLADSMREIAEALESGKPSKQREVVLPPKSRGGNDTASGAGGAVP